MKALKWGAKKAARADAALAARKSQIAAVAAMKKKEYAASPLVASS